MQTKLFEVRDSGTLYAVLAVRLGGRTATENWLLDRSGYARGQDGQRHYVLCCLLDPSVYENGECIKATYDPYSWGDNRTMRDAHSYIIDRWLKLKSGDVVDAEYVRGERVTPKLSDRLAELLRKEA